MPQLRDLFVTAAAFVLLSTTAAHAHVALDAPNGGETLHAGEVFVITWHDTIPHGPADYDLWYSVEGPDGPWIDIAADLTPQGPSYTYEWTVPATPSTSVRVMVQQDNAGTDYTDVSDGDLTIVADTTLTATLEPVADATLYEGDGSLANGAGQYLFSGRTQSQNDGLERRALLAFDVASALPAGSTVVEVSLEFTVSRTSSGAQTMDLRRVLEPWTEGPSDPAGEEGGGAGAEVGDTTWIHRTYPDTPWSAAGGTFSPTASAAFEVAGVGPVIVAGTPGMAADVQDWLDHPADDHGWALVMADPPVGSAKRLDSRETASGNGPRLVITYEPGMEPPVADFSYSPSQPIEASPVAFSDASTGPPTSWSWDFGDGTTSYEQNPSHVFDLAGTYTVTLTASNEHGSDSHAETVDVLPREEPLPVEVVLIPAAANARGSGDSFFVTTADIYNAGGHLAVFQFLWLPRDSDNAQPTTSPTYALEPGHTQRFGDLLGEAFSLADAVGAVAVISDSADLDVMSRTFNLAPGGTFGQSLPGVTADELIPAGTRARLMFLTENDDFRTNLGVVNGTDAAITVHVELFAGDGSSLDITSVQLPPWGNTQLNRVLAFAAPVEAAYAHLWTDTTGGAFTCYASVLDETTSDPTTVLPRQ